MTCNIEIFNSFQTNGISHKAHAIKSGVVHCISIYLYIEGSQVIKKKIVLLSLKIHLVLAKSVDPDEMQHIMWHFIRVFTVCQNISLGVSGLQRVKDIRNVLIIKPVQFCSGFIFCSFPTSIIFNNFILIYFFQTY